MESVSVVATPSFGIASGGVSARHTAHACAHKWCCIHGETAAFCIIVCGCAGVRDNRVWMAQPRPRIIQRTLTIENMICALYCCYFYYESNLGWQLRSWLLREGSGDPALGAEVSRANQLRAVRTEGGRGWEKY